MTQNLKARIFKDPKIVILGQGCCNLMAVWVKIYTLLDGTLAFGGGFWASDVHVVGPAGFPACCILLWGTLGGSGWASIYMGPA